LDFYGCEFAGSHKSNCSIMVLALRDFESLRIVGSGYAIDKAMFARDPSRPPALQRFFKRLRFAEAFKWIAPDIPDEFIN